MGLSKGSAKRERKQRKSGKAVKRRKRGNRRSKRRMEICRDLGRDLDWDLGRCPLRVSCEIYCFCNWSHPCTLQFLKVSCDVCIFTWHITWHSRSFYYTPMKSTTSSINLSFSWLCRVLFQNGNHTQSIFWSSGT